MRKLFYVVIVCAATSAFGVSGGICGLRAGCGTRPNFTTCIQCCHGAGCQEEPCRQFCWNQKGRFRPGIPNSPLQPVI